MVRTSASINLATKISEQLPPELIAFMQLAGRIAQQRGQRLYLVGGVVRDLLLGRANFDLDLVLEGDAISLAQEIALVKQGKVTAHQRFGTAKLRWDNFSVDFTTARSESYPEPCALPVVKPASIKEDLFRRDFTINAMAVELSPAAYGQLLDLYGGRSDLEGKLIRVLHERSFIDDATRIWRGLRYEQRLGFELEPVTLRWLKRDIAYLDRLSGDRLRHELELALKEECPERVLRRADQLGVLARLHPGLKGDGWLAEKFSEARRLSAPDLPSFGLYLSLLGYHLSGEEAEELISRLRLPKLAAQALRDTINLRDELALLADPELPPSRIYFLVCGYSTPAVMANFLVGESAVARQHLGLFLRKLRYVKPALNGEALTEMGMAPGPQIKETLKQLLEARLDGRVKTRRDEESLVKRLLA